MKVERNLVDDYIERISLKISLDKNRREEIYQTLLNKYNLPINISSDIITSRKGPQEFSDFVIFCILYVMDNKSIKRYFTSSEIEFYENSKFQIEKTEMPLVINDMIQVSEDQWIGRTTVKELMKLSQADLINYNINTQRTMKRIIRGEQVLYKISINKASVNAIRNSMQNGSYIPNTITLNFPENAVFRYSNHSLIIDELEYFDILDGYHRFVSMCQAYNMDSNFDYEMELRIVNFSEAKAQHFIYQEDQKTKMRKIDSDSMNQYNAANIIIKRLNEDPMCDIQGMINRNSGIVPAAELAKLIHYYYLRDINAQSNNRIVINETTKELKEKINVLMQECTELYNKRWTMKTLCIVMFSIYESIETRDICRIYKKLQEESFNLTEQFFNNAIQNNHCKRIYNSLKKVLES